MQLTTKQTYQIFWRHIRHYKLVGFFMVLTLAGAIIADLIQPLYYKRFFDVLTGAVPGGNATVATLTGIIVIVLALNAIEWVFGRIATSLNVFFECRIMADIANESFDYLERHSYTFFVNRFVGSLVRRFNRLVDAFEDIVDRFYWDIFPIVLRLGVIIAIIAWRSTTLALIMSVWVVAYLAVNYYITMFKLKYDEASAEADSAVTGRLSDTLSNNTTIKLFSGLAHEIKGFAGLTEAQFKIKKRAYNIGTVIDGIQAAFMVALEFAVFYFAIRFWNRGMLTLGDFVLIQVYIIQIFSRLWDFGRVFRTIYRRLADSKEMVEILNTPHEITDKPTAKPLVVTAGAIEFRNVSFNYHETRRIIRNFNLNIAPGEKVGLVGPSGAGKSTLVGLIFRLFEVSEGGMYIDGQNIADVTQDSLRGNIALVPQDPVLFHRTLMENIRYGRRDATDEEVVAAARLAHCDEFIEQLPEWYDSYVGEKGLKLSGGERQRVAIARAILKNAPILVLDEATSSLDSRSEAIIKDALENLMRGKTTIVIAHRLSTIMRMDRIVVVKNGKIVETGSHRELLKKCNGLYRGLWELQAGGFIAS
jgi:ATP-binding cassette subfamily B protein